MLSYSWLSFIVWSLVGNIPTTVSGHSYPFCYCHNLFVLSEIEGEQVSSVLAVVTLSETCTMEADSASGSGAPL